MMRSVAIRLRSALALLSLFLVACAAETPAPTAAGAAAAPDDAAILRAEQDYTDFVVATSPEHATILGLHARDGELDDRSLAAWNATVAREEAMLRDLQARFASPRASLTARTDLTILEHTLAVDVYWQRARRPLETQPDVYAAPLDAIFTMTARDYAPAAVRAHAVLARLAGIPAVVAAAKANLKSPPRVWTEVGMERADGAKTFFAELRPQLVSALKDEPDSIARIDAALATGAAAYADYRAFLEHEVLPRSTGSFAAGPEAFAFLVHENDYLTEDTKALKALGARVFAETNAQMNALAATIDPAAKGWPDVTTRLKAKHPPAADLLRSYAHEVERARAFLALHDVVAFPPGDVCQAIDTPPFQRSTISAAYDEAPAFDQDPHGFFFVTPVDPSTSPEAQEEVLRENDYADEVDTAVHETYPGHHLQISFARLYPSRIRKATAPDIFEEGWAFYAEELMNELGYYTKEERLMQLEWTLVRAARVLIDVGLHTEGMTFDQAVALLTEQVHLERSLAESEVKRYTLEPTQPLAYVVGREKILELRRRYQAREGSRYTLKAFHTEVLSHGAIAPALLAQEMFQ
jgi:uncharacterized protein (DUF885 family)